MRVRGAPPLVLALLLCGGGTPGPLSAQRPAPAVDAGAVATWVVRIPAGPSDGAARYRLTLEPGFRPFLPPEGDATLLGGRFVVPVTFSTPERLAAGRVLAGRLELSVDGGPPTTHPIHVVVRSRREIRFALEAAETVVVPDGVAEIPFRAENRGNVADTVFVGARLPLSWTVFEAPRIVLEPGDSARGAVRVRAPGRAAPGERQLALVTARTRDWEATESVPVVVVSARGPLGDLAHVPSSLFVGQSVGALSTPVVALSGVGTIAEDTELRLDLRHSEGGAVDPALQRQLAGPRLRLGLTGPAVRAELGDVYAHANTLNGYQRQARGARVAYEPASGPAARILAAVPTSLNGHTQGGHVVHAEADVATRWGRVGVLAGDLRQPGTDGVGEARSTGAGLRWQGENGPHQGLVEATFVRMTAADTLPVAGPAVDARYALRTEDVTGRFHLRRVPGGVTSVGGQGDEISASLSARVATDIHLVGWGYGTDRTVLGAGLRSETRAANLGVRTRLGPVQLQVAGNLFRRRGEEAGLSSASGRRTVRTEASTGLGPWSLEADAELGRAEDTAGSGTFRSLAGGVRWYGGDHWGWARVQRTVQPASATTAVQAGGTVRTGPVELSAGTTASWGPGETTRSLWTIAEVETTRNVTLHLGSWARPSLAGSDWTFSIGLSRRLNLPLPLPRHPDLRGEVFIDADDDGIRDPGEEGVADVTLRSGYLRATTDDDGVFAFRDAGATPVVEPATIPLGYVVSPRSVLPARGVAAVALLETAAVELRLFLDRDEDGTWDPAESAGAGTLVTLTDGRGRRRVATADERGVVRVDGLLPGRYDVTARAPGATERAERPVVLMEIELRPGQALSAELPVPLERRTIRMGPGSDLSVRGVEPPPSGSGG